jgi:hypothetical protein
MATRSTIAIEYANGWIEQIYCHWDGYPTHNGMILLQHYGDPAKVAQLMRLGSLSCLGKELGEQHDFNSRDHDTWCTFYRRDRGEPFRDTQANEFRDFEGYCNRANFEDYNYILRADGHWYVAVDDDIKLLADVLADELHRQKTDEEVDN